MPEVIALDQAVHAWMQSHRVPLLTPLMLLITHVHGTVGLLLLSLALALRLWWRGERGWLLALLLAVPGAMLLNVSLKNLAQRTRPMVEQPLLELTGYSFPSGHAAAAAAFYAFVAAWLWSRPWRPGQRWAVLLGCAAMMVWVDLSRVYLGAHYLTDVLVGSVIGVAWTLGCVALLRQRLQPRGAARLQA